MGCYWPKIPSGACCLITAEGLFHLQVPAPPLVLHVYWEKKDGSLLTLLPHHLSPGLFVYFSFLSLNVLIFCTYFIFYNIRDLFLFLNLEKISSMQRSALCSLGKVLLFSLNRRKKNNFLCQACLSDSAQAGEKRKGKATTCSENWAWPHGVHCLEMTPLLDSFLWSQFEWELSLTGNISEHSP